MPEVRLSIERKGRRRDILIPYSHNIDGGQLEEIIEWQKEKTTKELDAMPPKPKRTMSEEETGKVLHEYTQFRKRKRESPNKKYF